VTQTKRINYFAEKDEISSFEEKGDLNSYNREQNAKRTLKMSILILVKVKVTNSMPK
jgi:hypothetical protein